eukprot:1254472-Prymnesium_polylepis.1
MFARWLALCCVARASADSTPRININTQVRYTSPWSGWPALESARDILGTMNGPHEIYPLDGPSEPYDTAQYVSSFKELSGYVVRFNDLNYAQGAFNTTSITQIFTAWPTTDASLSALTAADIAALTSNDSNFVWDGVDYHVGGACDAGVQLMDFRIGDTWHVTDCLNKGEAVPISEDDTITFPSDWAFPTNVLTQTGLDLYAAVAVAVAKRVASLCGSQKLVFDMLTEVYVDSSGTGHFWPHNATVYATLYGATMSAIKAALGSDSTKFAGPNVIPSNSANEAFLDEFLDACYSLGYDACPLDIVTFHYFSTDSGRATTFAKLVRSKVWSQFQGTDFPVPRMGIS